MTPPPPGAVLDRFLDLQRDVHIFTLRTPRGDVELARVHSKDLVELVADPFVDWDALHREHPELWAGSPASERGDSCVES